MSATKAWSHKLILFFFHTSQFFRCRFAAISNSGSQKAIVSKSGSDAEMFGEFYYKTQKYFEDFTINSESCRCFKDDRKMLNFTQHFHKFILNCVYGVKNH